MQMVVGKKQVPTPGIEPGPPAWKAGILTTRPYGIGGEEDLKFIYPFNFDT